MVGALINMPIKRKHKNKNQALPKLDVVRVLDSCKTSFPESLWECKHIPKFLIFLNYNREYNYVVKLDININLKNLQIFVKTYKASSDYYIPNKVFTYNIGKSNWKDLHLVLPIFLNEVQAYIKEYLFLKPKL